MREGQGLGATSAHGFLEHSSLPANQMEAVRWQRAWVRESEVETKTLSLHHVELWVPDLGSEWGTHKERRLSVIQS